MAPSKKKEESNEDLSWGWEIYGDNAVKLCKNTMKAGLLDYNEAGEDQFWERYIVYKKRGDTIYLGEEHRARWFTVASLFAEFWGEADFSRFCTPEVPMSVAEYKEQNAHSGDKVGQGAGSAAVSSGSSGQDGKTIGGEFSRHQWLGRQPPTAPRAMREGLPGPRRISSGPSCSGGDLAAGRTFGAANFPVPNETKCKCTCKCCLVRCTGAGATETSITSGTEVKGGRPAVETATLRLSNQMKRNRRAGDPTKSGQTGTSGVIRTTKRESPRGGGGQTVNRMATTPMDNPQHASSRGVDHIDEVIAQHLKRSFSPYGDDEQPTYTLSQAPKRLRRDEFSSVDRDEVRDDRIGVAGFGVRPSTSGAYLDRSQGPARGVHANNQSSGPRIKAEIKEEEEEEVKIKSEPEPEG